MTAGTTRFTTREWSVIAGGPLLAAMAVLAGEHGRARSTLGGPGACRGARSTPGVVRAFRDARSTLGVVRAYRVARGAYDTELLRDLLATSPAGAIHRPHDPEELIADATAALRRAMGDPRARRHRRRASRVPEVRPGARRRGRPWCESPGSASAQPGGDDTGRARDAVQSPGSSAASVRRGTRLPPERAALTNKQILSICAAALPCAP
jgi:hypothetical protein